MMVWLTFLSLALAFIMSVVAWRVVRDDRRRSAARIAALAADIHGVDALAMEFPEESSPGFVGPRTILAAVGVAVVVLLAGLLSVQRSAPAEPSVPVSVRTAPPALPGPLELVSLDHERSDDGLVVRGVVRNPSGAAPIDQLTAVILVFNQQGGFLTSGRGGVEATTLEPGADASFTISIPGAANVGRYRVSFRTGDRVVPHVDKRES